MRRLWLLCVFLLVPGLIFVPQPIAAESADDAWPQYRGWHAQGIATTPAPLTWNAETGENIAWKTAIPGLGHAAPVVWGDQVYVLTAVGEAGAELKAGLYGDIAPVQDESVLRWHVLAIARDTGKILWDKVVHEGKPAVKRHPKATHANSTPVTNGEVVCVFLGSEGLHCLRTADGAPAWSKDFGVLDSGFFMMPQAQWGFGASPVIHENMLIVQADVQKGSFVAAFEVATGKELWRTAREEVPTWSTPTVHVGAKRSQVVVNGFKHIGGYDLATGKELWRLAGGGDIPVPTPFVAHDMVFVTNSHGLMSPIYAIDLAAVGDLTPDYQAMTDPEKEKSASKNPDEPGRFIKWMTTRGGAYMPTPIVVDDLLYLARDGGILVVYDAKTGDEVFKERITGTAITASPVAAAGRLYLTNETGDVFVIKTGRDYELLATNELGETTLSTPAISGGMLFFRTRDALIAVGETKSAGAATGD
ncbi:MAG: PQQ-binding-like beta-propeller repeat protein [Acidobacteriota bacterium]